MIKEKNGKEKQTRQRVNVLLIKYFKWLTAFLVLVVLALGYFFLLKPKYEAIAQLAKEGQSSKEQEYLERQKYLDDLKNLVAVFRTVKSSEIKKIDYILKKKDVPEELFTEVGTLIKKNGLLLNSIKIEPGAAESKDVGSKVSRTTEEKKDASLPPEIERTKVTLEVLGVDYFSLKNLLASIENNLMLMDVVSVDFSPDKDSVPIVFYTYDLKE